MAISSSNTVPVNRISYDGGRGGLNGQRPQMLATPYLLATEYRAPAAHPGAVPNGRVLPSANPRQQSAANPGFAGNRTGPNARPEGQGNRMPRSPEARTSERPQQQPNQARRGEQRQFEQRPATPQPRTEQRPTPQQQRQEQMQQRPAQQRVRKLAPPHTRNRNQLLMEKMVTGTRSTRNRAVIPRAMPAQDRFSWRSRPVSRTRSMQPPIQTTARPRTSLDQSASRHIATR